MNNERIKKIISSFGLTENGLSNEDVIGVVDDLLLFELGVLKKNVALLMIFYVQNYNKSNDALESVVDFIRFLIVPVLSTDSFYNDIKNAFGEESVVQLKKDDVYASRRRVESFCKFSEGEIESVVDWLNFAKNWECLKWNVEEVEEALRYWNDSNLGELNEKILSLH